MIRNSRLVSALLLTLVGVMAACVLWNSDPTADFSFFAGAEVLESDRPRMWQYVEHLGKPTSVEFDSPHYPDARSRERLARCVDGEPRCVLGAPCFGWAELGFTVDGKGRAELPVLLDACPYPVLTEPFLAALKTWRFMPWKTPRMARTYTSTTMAYPIDPDY